MSRGILLDTHAWLWLFANSRQLSAPAIADLRYAADTGALYVAAFSLFEAVYLAQRKRIVLTLPIADWLDLLLREPSVEIIPISKSIAVSSTNLPVNFHGDPGDRLIAATAIDQELTLCTHDRALLRFGEQGLYQTLEV